MKFTSLSSLIALTLASLLSACGGSVDQQPDAPFQTAAVMQAVAVSGPAPAAAAVQPAQKNQPQPDCAPEGCKGLRIIDGNAEAYRLAAIKRAQNPGLL
jgi:hypothetical protein